MVAEWRQGRGAERDLGDGLGLGVTVAVDVAVGVALGPTVGVAITLALGVGVITTALVLRPTESTLWL